MDSDSSPSLIDVLVECSHWHSALPDLESLARRAVATALGLVGDPSTRRPVTVLLTDDEQIRELNRTWRGKDSPTDVLSFPAGPRPPGLPEEEPWPLGDLALAFATTERDARALGRPLADHFTHLVVHGTLHLLGFDHEEPDEAERMQALERQILAALGIELGSLKEPIEALETAP